jgi:hypothetical protein
MYTKLELLEIFSNLKTEQEFNKALDAVLYLIEIKVMERTPFLYRLTQETYRKILNL